jgi:twitching motility protein PilT
VFPAGEKPMVRSMLSESLRAVISQALLKKTGGGRTAAMKSWWARRPSAT